MNTTITTNDSDTNFGHNTTILMLDVTEYCPRCNEPAINDAGLCGNCSFKAWHAYH